MKAPPPGTAGGGGKRRSAILIGRTIAPIPFPTQAPTDPLMAEWLATPSLNSRQRRQLEALGVARETIHRAGDLGWSRVQPTGRGYQPSDGGDVMLIQPVWAGPAPSIYEGVENPQLADLIAWHPARPTRWFYRECTPGAVLGSHNLDIAHSEDLPISLAITPLSWLLGNCRGACLLEVCEAHWRAVDQDDEAAALAQWGGGDVA